MRMYRKLLLRAWDVFRLCHYLLTRVLLSSAISALCSFESKQSLMTAHTHTQQSSNICLQNKSQKSNKTHLFLRDLTSVSSGTYSCEITLDNYETSVHDGYLTVKRKYKYSSHRLCRCLAPSLLMRSVRIMAARKRLSRSTS